MKRLIYLPLLVMVQIALIFCNRVFYPTRHITLHN